MSPKGRKSLGTVWYNCENCGITLTQKDIQVHRSDSCPPDETNWTHGFIKDNTLYSFIEATNISDVPDVGTLEKQCFVFISQSAMQLCNLEIGQDVLLVINNTESLVRKVWPTSDRSLVSVLLLEDTTLGKKQESIPENCKVRLKKLPKNPYPASVINLTTTEEIGLNNLEHLLTLCKQKYKGQILKPKMKICLQFYGKEICFIVKDISFNFKEDSDLTEQFKELSIGNNIDKDSYFVIVESTNWEITLNKKNDVQDTIHKVVNFNSIGGYKEIKQELFTTVSSTLQNKESLCYSNSMGVLLHGPNGVGKTFMVQALANEVKAHLVHVNNGELFSKFYGETELRLKQLFTEAKQKSPSMIVIDNIETLCPKRSGTEQERRVFACLLTQLDSVRQHKVLVVAITSQLSFIDSSLRRPGRLDWEIELHIPSVEDRFDILKVLLSDWSVEDPEVMNVASAAHGYVAADLECLVAKAIMQAVEQNKHTVDASNLSWALSQVKPSAMREVLIQVPNVKWSDIGGMDDLKLKLKQSIEWPLSHPEAFARLGVKPPRGVLMYGPPGCSKTMIAKALATESKLNFLSIKGSELFSKWVGESEKAVQSLFRRARAVAPSIVFLDELDAIGGERSGSSEGSNVQERVLAQLLTEMDGVEPLGDVNIVAATNRPDRVDKALLRPGRLDRLVYVPLPSYLTRTCILQLQLSKMPVASDIEIDHLAIFTDGYSGAEVVAVCHEAAISALQEDFNVTEVCMRHFQSALATVRPRTPKSLLTLYETYPNSKD